MLNQVSSVGVDSAVPKIGSYAVLELQPPVLQEHWVVFCSDPCDNQPMFFTLQTRRAVNVNWWIDKKIIHYKNLNSKCVCMLFN